MIKCKVVVLMSTYNGERYLKEQLDSLLAQEKVHVEILVRDDGSKDNTTKILDQYQNLGKLRWYQGENLKPAMSFMDLLKKAPEADYYAFCDQDDYWLKDKLHIAVDSLENIQNDRPKLYYGRPRLVDSNLQSIENPQKTLDHMDTVESSIINILCTGCTVVFNRNLLQKLNSKNPSYVYMHDAWVHQVCLITGGTIYFDQDVHILYRQHGNNVIGISTSYKKVVLRKIKSLIQKDCCRSRLMKSLLDCYADEMTPECKMIFEEAAYYRHSLKNKMKLFFDFRICSGYVIRDLLFRAAVLLNSY